ncbi:MAG: MBL fold metallo-hydrolase [Candidatus Calescibacterium sp.]|nr:MBL fold metallo-hydrolase [Candidatus Calescibacterium sp.]MDW8132910.1 MBL fold metallo-hydrolase [Candidatus Calescibacterium sp.]
MNINFLHNNEIREKYLKSFVVKEASFGKVFGSPYTFLYLIDGVLFDTSVSAWAYLLCQKLKSVDWKKKIFLTHSHYDHLGGVSVIQSLLGKIEVYANSYVAKVLNSKTALEIIRKFDAYDSEEIKKFHEIDNVGFDSFTIDFLFDFDTNDYSVIEGIDVIYTPGHTKDTVSYYIPKYNSLVMSESMGIPNYRFTFVLPEFLTSYSLYVKSFEKLKNLVLDNKISNFLLPHIMYFEYFSDVRDFIRLSEISLNMYVKQILGFLEKVGVNKDMVVEKADLKTGDLMDLKIRDVFNMVLDGFYVKYELSQPLYGFEANVKAQIRTIIKELL